jgi:hypothetical protein
VRAVDAGELLEEGICRLAETDETDSAAVAWYT